MSRKPNPENIEKIRSYIAADVAWYRIHGRFPTRIRRDREGREYVVGDETWNEFVDARMTAANTTEIGKSKGEVAG